VPLVIVLHGLAAPGLITGSSPGTSPGWVRSSAWIWLFSSIDSTTAWAGGSTDGSGWWPARGQAPSPAMSISLAMNLRSCERLKVRRRCDCGLLRPTDPLPRTQRDADGFGHRPARRVGRLARRWGAKPALAKAGVNATTRAVVSAAIGALPGLRVLSRNKPSTPPSVKRCCHRPPRRPTDADALRHLRRVPIRRGKHDAAPVPHVGAAGCSRPRSPPTARAPLRSKPRILVCRGPSHPVCRAAERRFPVAGVLG
jgi:hypothetical protein